jgi:hypothetical protein
MDEVVARALAKSPADRYLDGRAFADALEDVLAGRPPRDSSGAPPRATLVSAAGDVSAAASAPPMPAPETVASAVTRRGVLVIAGVMTVAVLALLPTVRKLVPSVPIPTLAPRPARLEVDLEHPLRCAYKSPATAATGARRLSGSFESGGSRRLVIRVAGLLSKELNANWGT